MRRLILNLFGNRKAARGRSGRPSQKHRLLLEPLEDRSLMSVLLVDPQIAPRGGAFATISAAVNAAHNGDTINVVPGTYHEGVDVTKSVTIIGGVHFGLGIGQFGPSIVLANPASTGFAFDANNITVENFTISQEADAIRTDAAFSGFHVLNDNFVDDQSGVHLNTSLDPLAQTSTISGNTFTFDNHGVAAHDDVLIDNGGARNVVISGNFFHASEIDASISVAAKNQSSNVQIVNNRFSSASGIVIANTDKAKVDNNIFANPAGGDGVFVAGGVTNSEVAGNTLTTSQTLTGILLAEGVVQTANSGNTIAKNTLVGFGTGILLSGSSQTILSGNDVAGSQKDGIELTSTATTSTVSGNTVFQSGLAGIHLASAKGSTVSNNTIEDSGQSGVFLDGASSNMVVANRVNDSGGDGITLSHANGNTISNNTTDDNTLSGILLNGASGNTLLGNVAIHNLAQSGTSAGISLQSSTGNTLTSNEVEFTQDTAFYLVRSNSNSLSNNTARFDNTGFDLDHATNNTLSGNVASHDRQGGFQLGDFATGNTLSGDTAQNDAFGFSADGLAVGNTPGGNTLTHDVASNNQSDGFLIFHGANTLSNDVANGNGNFGFDLVEVSGSSLKANTANNNLMSGFFFHGTGVGNTVSGNTANNNLGDGFHLQDIGTSTIAGNTADGNATNGISLVAGSKNTLSGNTADNNSGGDGIRVDAASAGNTITGNTALGNGYAVVGGFDLFDGSLTTTHNAWSNNKARTRNPFGLQ
jgi:parallel beta-helix repeat protein